MPFGPHPLLSHEEQARLLLWLSTADQVASILTLAQRAWDAASAVDTQAKDLAWSAGLHRFARTQPDYQPGTQKLSHSVAYEERFPQAFPSGGECIHIAHSLRMLAAVLISQLRKAGYAQQGNVSGNTTEFSTKHLKYVLSKAFPETPAAHRFLQTLSALETARDEMLAHADASAFSVESIPAGIRANLLYVSVADVDFTVFASDLSSFINALQNYLFPRAA